MAYRYSMAQNKEAADRNHEIKRLYWEENWSQRRIGEKFGLTTGRVSLIVNNPLSDEYIEPRPTERIIVDESVEKELRRR
jgi:DNA-binding transcriptional regulator LsrR (DeoR family)